MKSEIKTLDLSEIIDIEKIIDREEINQLERQKHLLFNPRLYFDGDAGNVLEYLLIALKNTVSDSDFILDGVNKLGREMGLLFAPNPVEGNVCFAENNEEMRDEFKQVFTPADLRDFLYAVVFTSLYQNDGENSLPRIPLLTDSLDFWQLVRLGGNLRLVHLLECPAVEKEITIFKGKGDDEVKEVKYDEVVISPPPSRQDESTPPPEGNLVPAHSALDQKASRAGSPPLEGSGVVGKTQPPTTNSGYESKASRAGSPPLEGSGVV
ncbi:MAG: hypothetical protein J5I50_13305, partial [Chitinophagaceae bacterium]|nr:hypothetical protein [Chitinophagaceae bacterium]